MRFGKTGAVLLIAAIVPALARAQATVSFDAEFAKAAAKAHVPFKAGGVEWSCSTTRCTGNGSGKDPLGTCKAIVPQVGALKSFTAAGRAVDLHACGAVATTMTAAPVSRTAPVSTVKPATGAAAATAATAHPPAPAAAPSKKSSAPAGGLAWTASAMTLTGTGVAAPRPAFTPLAWTADPMSLTGTGAAAATHTTSLTWTTDTMKLTGHP